MGLQVTAIFRACRAMPANELMYDRTLRFEIYLRADGAKRFAIIAFILPFHKIKPNARLSSVWLCRYYSVRQIGI